MFHSFSRDQGDKQKEKQTNMEKKDGKEERVESPVLASSIFLHSLLFGWSWLTKNLKRAIRKLPDIFKKTLLLWINYKIIMKNLVTGALTAGNAAA